MIELVLSIFILSVAVVGIFNAFSIMTTLTSDSTDRLTATYLAQEGMEIARNIRDTNWLNMDTCSACAGSCPSFCPATWHDGLTSPVNCSTATGGLGCQADYTSASMAPYVAGSSYLYLDAAGFYENAGTANTKFERKFIIDSVADVNNQPNDHIIKVTVQVSWNEKANILRRGYTADEGMANCSTRDNCVTAVETLYDWYNYKYQ